MGEREGEGGDTSRQTHCHKHTGRLTSSHLTSPHLISSHPLPFSSTPSQELASKDTSPKGSRVKRWLRILQEAVWPEVFRRAVLFTRGLKDFDPRHFLDILK